MIEEILGFSLPKSAYEHRAFFSNSLSHPIAHTWIDNGYTVERVEKGNSSIFFVKYQLSKEIAIGDIRIIDGVLCTGDDNFDFNHIYATISFTESNDDYFAKNILINSVSYPFEKKYPFRFQKNIHIIFVSESNVFTSVSFDGHKGQIYVNDNEIILSLVRSLNSKYGKSQGFHLDFDDMEIYKLLLENDGGEVPNDMFIDK